MLNYIIKSEKKSFKRQKRKIRKRHFQININLKPLERRVNDYFELPWLLKQKEEITKKKKVR